MILQPLNTVCPVCGHTIPENTMPMKIFHPVFPKDNSVSLRVCSSLCAERIRENPVFFHAAARENRRG
jgi:hypothetical protein